MIPEHLKGKTAAEIPDTVKARIIVSNDDELLIERYVEFADVMLLLAIKDALCAADGPRLCDGDYWIMETKLEDARLRFSIWCYRKEDECQRQRRCCCQWSWWWSSSSGSSCLAVSRILPTPFVNTLTPRQCSWSANMRTPSEEEIRRAVHKWLLKRDPKYKSMASTTYNCPTGKITVQWVDRHGDTNTDTFVM